MAVDTDNMWMTHLGWTDKGSSGAPLFRKVGKRDIIIAMHSRTQLEGGQSVNRALVCDFMATRNEKWAKLPSNGFVATLQQPVKTLLSTLAPNVVLEAMQMEVTPNGGVRYSWVPDADDDQVHFSKHEWRMLREENLYTDNHTYWEEREAEEDAVLDRFLGERTGAGRDEPNDLEWDDVQVFLTSKKSMKYSRDLQWESTLECCPLELFSSTTRQERSPTTEGGATPPPSGAVTPVLLQVQTPEDEPAETSETSAPGLPSSEGQRLVYCGRVIYLPTETTHFL
jgi:hypothetical protein